MNQKKIAMLYYKVVKYTMLLTINIYILMYIFAFYGLNLDEVDIDGIFIESDIHGYLYSIGVALIVSCIGYLRYTKYEGIQACRIAIVTGLIQIIIIGVPGIVIQDILPLPFIDVLEGINGINGMIKTLYEYERLNALQDICLIRDYLYIIEISVVVSIIISIINIFLEKKKKIFVLKTKKISSLSMVNIAMIIIMFIYYVVCEMSVNYYEFSEANWISGFPVMGSIIVFLLTVVRSLIKEKKYVLAGFSYIFCMLSIKNVVYYGYSIPYDYQDHNLEKNLPIFLGLLAMCTVLAMIIIIVGYVKREKSECMNSESSNMLIKIVKYNILLTTFIYLFMYIFAFYNLNIDDANIDIKKDIHSCLYIIGVALIINCIGYWKYTGRNEIKASITAIVTAIMQIAVLGIPGLSIRNILPLDFVDIMFHIDEMILDMQEFGLINVVSKIHMIIYCIFAIEICVIISMIISLVYIVITKRETMLEFKFPKISMMSVINIIMIIITLIYFGVCETISNNLALSDGKWITGFPVIGTITIVLLTVARLYIKEKNYLLTVISYVCCIVSIKNIAFYAYADMFEYYNRDFEKITHTFIVAMSVCVVIAIINMVVVLYRNREFHK